MITTKIWTIKNSDIRTNDYPSEQRDLISKGGFVFLHIMSSLLLSDAEYTDGKKSKLNIPISIEAQRNKNEFSKRKKWLFKSLDDDNLLKYYRIAKKIFFDASNKYAIETNKSKNSLFKYRGFDKSYLRPAIDNYYQSGAI